MTEVAGGTGIRILRLPDVRAKTGLSTSTLYALKDFPKPIKLTARAVGWVESDVETWLRGRAERRQARELIRTQRAAAKSAERQS